MGEKCSIDKAIEVLKENSETIHNVSEWAKVMHLSRSYFSRVFTQNFGLNPKEFLTDYRISLISNEIKQHPEAIEFAIAVNIGFADNNSLSKYLKYHFDKTFLEFKDEIIHKKTQIRY